MNITLKTKKLAPLDTKKLRASVLVELNRFSRDIKSEMDSITENWNHKPDWDVTTHYAGDNVYVSATTDDAIFHFLDEGTDERWAVMRSPYAPKTSPGQMGSFGGYSTVRKGYNTAVRGRVGMSNKGLTAQPGIEARGWTVKIQTTYEPLFQEAVDHAITKFLESWK